jgi:hypothetical protein
MLFMLHQSGVAFSNRKPWKVLQLLCLATLKDLGMGKQNIEKQIKEEVQCLMEELRKYQGELWGLLMDLTEWGCRESITKRDEEAESERCRVNFRERTKGDGD